MMKDLLTVILYALAAGNVMCVKFKPAKGLMLPEKGGRISVNNEATMAMKVDAGWYSYSYGREGYPAFRSFSVNNQNAVQLAVTSCFCPGNFFSIYDNGQPILITQLPLVGKSQKTPSQGPPVCNPRITEPKNCILSPSFSSGRVLLLPGRHNITIVANKSPYGGGTAFIRADSACPVPTGDSQPIEPQPCCLITNTCSQIIVA